MKIILIESYPLYNVDRTTQDWFQHINREKWIPSILKKLGHEVEYWIAGKENVELKQQIDDLPSYTTRIFKADAVSKRKKKHISKALNSYLKNNLPDHVIIKGVDGGIGLSAVKHILRPLKVPFSIIIGGEPYRRYLGDAKNVFYETEDQKNLLMDPGIKFFRKRIHPSQLFKLPKSIDTDIFKPLDAKKEFDIISVGRLIPRYKNYNELGLLSDKFRVGLIGDGSMLEELKVKYPKISFLGRVPNHDIPKYLAKSDVFFFTGKKDYNPRVITESLACGIPVVAFSHVIKSDVLPQKCGYRINEEDITKKFKDILSDRPTLQKKGIYARSLAVKERGKLSTLPVFKQVFGTA